MRAAAEIVLLDREIAAEIAGVADGLGAVVDVGAGAVDDRAAAVVVEIAGVAGVLEAGAAEGGTKLLSEGFPRIHTDRPGRTKREEPRRKSRPFSFASE